jgi:TonB family protein
MRMLLSVAVCVAAVLSAFGQATTPELPKDPTEILAAAAPFYDFNSSDLKPWHIKATYQLYDEKGDPAEQGTYEHWWVSPDVNRSTWTRSGASYSEWRSAGGRHAYAASGQGLNFFEFRLESSLLSPLPRAADTDPSKVRLERESISPGGVKLSCVMVVPDMPLHGQLQQVPLGMFPTYCFDPQMPILRLSYSFGTVTMEFNKIVKAQNRFLARELAFYEGKRKILTATVDTIDGIGPSDPALTPPPDAKLIRHDAMTISQSVAQGKLLHKEYPIYPEDAKRAHITGKVILQATIGRDGRVHDLRVVSAPWPSLAGAALWAVSRWQYQPYLVDGEPVEVDTTINVVFSLDR